MLRATHGAAIGASPHSLHWVLHVASKYERLRISTAKYTTHRSHFVESDLLPCLQPLPSFACLSASTPDSFACNVCAVANLCVYVLAHCLVRQGSSQLAFLRVNS